MNGNTISAIYSQMASGISFEKRKGFFEMPDEILDHRVEKVVITYKDRLSRVGFCDRSFKFTHFRSLKSIQKRPLNIHHHMNFHDGDGENVNS